jgi:hypothetical protein
VIGVEEDERASQRARAVVLDALHDEPGGGGCGERLAR